MSEEELNKSIENLRQALSKLHSKLNDPDFAKAQFKIREEMIKKGLIDEDFDKCKIFSGDNGELLRTTTDREKFEWDLNKMLGELGIKTNG